MVGEGSFGKVFQVTRNREVYALKECDRGKETTENEFHIVEKLMTHPMQSLHLVFFYMIYQKQEKNCYLMEFMNQGDFQAVLDSGQLVGNKKVLKCLAFQLLDGLSHLHDYYKIIHADFAPKNILLQRIGNEFFFKLADFGSAISFDNSDSPPKIGNTKLNIYYSKSVPNSGCT